MNDYLITFIFLLISGIFAVAGLIVLGVAYFKLRKIITSTSLKALVHAKYWDFGAALAALFGLIPLVLIGALSLLKAGLHATSDKPDLDPHGNQNSTVVSLSNVVNVPSKNGEPSKNGDMSIHVGSSHAHIFAYITLSLSTILFTLSGVFAILAINDINNGGAGNTIYYLTITGSTLMFIAALLVFGALIFIVCAIEARYHVANDRLLEGKLPEGMSPTVENKC